MADSLSKTLLWEKAETIPGAAKRSSSVTENSAKLPSIKELYGVSADSAAAADKGKDAGLKLLREETGLPLADAAPDSAGLTEKATSVALQALEKETGVTIAGVPKDSAAVAKKAKTEGLKILEKETGLSLANAVPDSAELTEKATSVALQALEKETGITVAGVPKDSAAVAKKAETEGLKILEKETGLSLANAAPDSAGLTKKVTSVALQALEKETGVAVAGVPKDSAAVAKKAETEGLKILEKETGIAINTIPKDSATLKKEGMALAKKELDKRIGQETPDITLDSTTVDQLTKEGEKHLEKALKNSEGFEDFGSLEEGNLNKLSDKAEISPEDLKKLEAEKKIKQKMTAQAREFMSKHADQIQKVQAKMSELKKKYSIVPNSNDLSTARKRSSLADEPLKKRLTFGLNFNISGTDPLTVDLSPALGYRFNKLFEAGVTGAYRSRFGSDNISRLDESQTYGYSIYANHAIFKNFFGYLEGENLSAVVKTEEADERRWHKTLLVGIGKTFKIAKILQMQTIVTYNFLHDNTDGIYTNPVVIKTGIRVVR